MVVWLNLYSDFTYKETEDQREEIFPREGKFGLWKGWDKGPKSRKPAHWISRAHVVIKSVWGTVRPASPAMATDIVKAESAGIL